MIRVPDENEKSDVRRLWEACFPEGGPAYVDWFFNDVYRREWSLGYYEGDALLSCLQMIPYTLRLRGRPVVMDTLSGVSTDPAARNRGHAKALMAESLADMASRGRGFTFLYPFDHCFYRKLGWETCSAALEYIKPAIELPAAMPAGYTAERMEPSEALFAPLYRRFMAGCNCCVERTSVDWGKRFGENRSLDGFAVAAYRGNVLAAYALVEENEGELLLSELVYDAVGAVPAILAALQPMGIGVNWKASADDRLHTTPGRWGDRVKLQPHVMLRIVDAPHAVAQTETAADGAAVLELADNYAPWNAGRFLLSAEDGQAMLVKTNREPQFHCDAGTLCRILTGYLTASDAVQAGLAQGEEDTVLLLDAMYPRQNNFIFELY